MSATHCKLIVAFTLCMTAGQYALSQGTCVTPAPYHCNTSDINSISAAIHNRGHITSIYWPNDGTNRMVNNLYYLILGATIDSQVRFTPYYINYQPGILDTQGNPDTVKTNWNTLYRVYRIAKNWERMRESSAKQLYRQDYLQWPSDLGAPVDSNGKALFVGDQTTWCVFNDSLRGNGFSPGHPLGAEVQMLTWAYETDPILRNVVFVKYTVINKSGKQWKDFYLGNYAEQNSGTDPSVELTYLHNSAISSTAFGYKIPAIGFTVVQGPVRPKIGKTAFDFGRYIDNAENVHTSSGLIYEPYLPFDSTVYSGLKGLNPFTRTPYIDPITGKPASYTFSGDPVTNTGWTIKNYSTSNFHESTLNTGPFDLAPNDTISIVGAIIVAQGKSNLESINILRHFARYVRSNYPSLLAPVRYPQPVVTSSVLSGRIILTWDTDAEQELVNRYKFQGYNVYQGESPSGPWHRIFTCDKNDGISVLTEEEYQPEFITISQRGIQALPNEGLQHHLIIERDSIKQTGIIDGRPYYFCVRAIWENSDNRPIAIESEIVPIRTMPEAVVPGSQIVEPLSLLTHNRMHDDALRVEVINPLQLKSNRYRAVVHIVHDTISWDVINDATNVPVFTGLTTTAGESTPIIDGFTLRLKKQLIGVRRDRQSPRGWEYLPEQNRWLTGASPSLLMDGFFNGLVYPTINNYIGRGGNRTKPDELKRIEIRFNSNITQKAYRYVDKVRGVPFNDPPKHPSFAPFILKKGVGYVYQDMVDVPFTVWEVDSLDGDLAPKQLAVAFVETNDSLYSSKGKYLGLGNVNGKWEPTTASNGGGELLLFFSSPYTETAQPQYIRPNIEPFFKPDSFDVMYILSSRTDTTLKKVQPYSFQDGDVFRITPNYQFKDGQTYVFSSSPGIVGSKSLAFEQKAMEKISVFPNPYMGGHALEQSPSQRFVRIINLSAPSTVRIFNLSGRLIRSFEHTSTTSGISDWDLRNDEGIKVASGLYLIHIESPGIGTKVLKLMVLYPDERLNAY